MKYLITTLALVMLSSFSFAADKTAEKKGTERKPASPRSFVCHDPLVANSVITVQNLLNTFCDSSKDFSVSFIQQAGYMVCCVQK